ncbi:MAG: glycosyltransferase family 39 protein, partial [Candidatus Omnitrophica bacterium]|nr:glycosyltransferase family 39 protein [Candidatus Omnitrophota bacterium]
MLPETHAGSEGASCPSLKWLRWGCFLFLCIGLLFFHFRTLHSSHNWGDDFTIYTIAAERLVEGVPFSDPVAFSGEQKVEVGNSIGYPLVLTPIVALFGNDCFHLKIPNIVCHVVAAVLIFAVSSMLTQSRVFPWIGFLFYGFFPYFNRFQNVIGPDLLSIATLLVLVGLVLVEPGEDRRKSIARYLLLSVVFAFHLLVRRQAWSIAPVILGWALWKSLPSARVDRWKGLIGVGLAFGVFALLFGGILIERIDYFWDGENLSSERIGARFEAYAGAVPRFFYQFSLNRTVTSIETGVWAFLSLFGLLSKIRDRGFGFLEFVLLFYLVPPFLFAASQQERYILPVFALSMIYLVTGLDSLFRFFWPSRLSVAFMGICFLLIFVWPGYNASKYYYHSLSKTTLNGPYDEVASELFEFSSENLEEDAEVLFFKPRAFHLFTGRVGWASMAKGMTAQQFEK